MKSILNEEKVYNFTELKRLIPQKIEQLILSDLLKTHNGIYRLAYRVPSVDLLAWLNHQSCSTKFYCSNRNGELETASLGMADCFQGSSLINITKTFHSIHNNTRLGDGDIHYYGGFCFHPQADEHPWNIFKVYQFFMPRFEFIQTHQETYFAVHFTKKNRGKRFLKKILEDFTSILFHYPELPKTVPPLSQRKDVPSSKEWLKQVRKIIHKIRKGHLEKVVLARKSEFLFERSPNPLTLMQLLKEAASLNCFHFCFQPQKDYVFLGASPERLYKRKGRDIESEAIAGTRPRGGTPSEDQQLTKDLLDSPKDYREHRFVVEAIRSAFEKVCESFSCQDQAELLQLESGQHLITRFKGKLKKNISDLDLLKILSPTPAVAGSPTAKALREIQKREAFNRGWYAAPVGYLAKDQAEFIVAIRSGLLHKNKLDLYAGAGIVKESDPEEEWQEIENKISSFLKITQQI